VFVRPNTVFIDGNYSGAGQSSSTRNNVAFPGGISTFSIRPFESTVVASAAVAAVCNIIMMNYDRLPSRPPCERSGALHFNFKSARQSGCAWVEHM